MESYTMLFTSLVVTVAVAGVAPSLTPATQPKWQPDYSTAFRVAAAEHKPLAVFVGHGQAGFAQLVTDGGPAAPVTQTLSEKFVSVYVDADSAAGKSLAQALKVTDGLVISDRSGSVVALRHQGPVAPTVLSSYVTTYADQPVVQAAPAPVFAAPSFPAPVFSPAPVFAPNFGGSCPNGRCGLQPFGGVVGNVFPSVTGGCANGQCGRPAIYR